MLTSDEQHQNRRSRTLSLRYDGTQAPQRTQEFALEISLGDIRRSQCQNRLEPR
jgi:hypothetical protein